MDGEEFDRQHVRNICIKCFHEDENPSGCDLCTTVTCSKCRFIYHKENNYLQPGHSPCDNNPFNGVYSHCPWCSKINNSDSDSDDVDVCSNDCGTVFCSCGNEYHIIIKIIEHYHNPKCRGSVIQRAFSVVNPSVLLTQFEPFS